MNSEYSGKSARINYLETIAKTQHGDLSEHEGKIEGVTYPSIGVCFAVDVAFGGAGLLFFEIVLFIFYMLLVRNDFGGYGYTSETQM